MSVSICSSCLARLRISPKLFAACDSLRSTSFHTTSSQYASPPKKKGGGNPSVVFKTRESRSARIKKKARARPNPPAPGEIRTQRKRIVLSNPNALDIPGMEDLSAENMSDATKIGQMLGLGGVVLDQLRAVNAFKTTQCWDLFRRPATLIREETVELGQDFEDVNDSVGGAILLGQDSQEGQSMDRHAGPKTLRQIIAGERLSGKSTLLLQAMSMAFLNKWIVINVPEGKLCPGLDEINPAFVQLQPVIDPMVTDFFLAQDFVNNNHAYGPVPPSKDTSEQLYSQPSLTAKMLSRMARANGDVLSKLKVSHDHSTSNVQISQDMSLKDLALQGASDVRHAWSIWQALWKELTSPLDNDIRPPPILFAVDGIDHWMCPSQYRASDYSVIHAHQFLLVRQFLSLLFSRTQALPNGGIIVAATTASNSPSTPTFDLLLEQLEVQASRIAAREAPDQPETSDLERDVAQTISRPNPFHTPDQRVLNLFDGEDVSVPEPIVKRLHGLSKAESKGLLNYFARSGIIQTSVPVRDIQVAEAWTLSGGGVIGQLERLGTRLRV